MTSLRDTMDFTQLYETKDSMRYRFGLPPELLCVGTREKRRLQKLRKLRIHTLLVSEGHNSYTVQRPTLNFRCFFFKATHFKELQNVHGRRKTFRNSMQNHVHLIHLGIFFFVKRNFLN